MASSSLSEACRRLETKPDDLKIIAVIHYGQVVASLKYRSNKTNTKVFGRLEHRKRITDIAHMDNTRYGSVKLGAGDASESEKLLRWLIEDTEYKQDKQLTTEGLLKAIAYANGFRSVNVLNTSRM